MSALATLHPRLPAELLEAFGEADDPREIAAALAGDLRSRLGAVGVSVHESVGERSRIWARAGLTRPPLAARAAQIWTGGHVAGGFACIGASGPQWLVLCDRDTAPEEAELAYLRAATDAACLAAAVIRRADRMRTEARTGRALVELGQALSLEHGEDRVLHMLTLAVSRLLENSGVATWRRDGDGYRLSATFGYPPRIRPHPGSRARMSERLAELTASRRIRVAGSGELSGIVRRGRALLAPIGERAANRALLVVERDRDADGAEEALLLGVSDQALLALENERLLEEQRSALEGVVACLGRALSVRHRETGEHSDRLTADCVAVGRALGLEGEQLRELKFAAALHDLGKIGVPERVLQNAGPLDADGWRLIHMHPELGARIIDPVDALRGAAELVRACHEHWDGSGYPRGLAGDAIPLGSRIILVCDAYHAMCEHRSYQAALPPEEACARLRELAGADFDPRVVAALHDHLAAGGSGPL